MIEKTKISSAIFDGFLSEFEEALPPTSKLGWLEKPISFRSFVESPEHMGFPRLSERQYEVADFMLGEKADAIFDNKNTIAVLLWSKGSGKDSVAVLIILYIVYWLLCLESPQKFLGMPEGEALDILNVAANAEQARTIFFDKLRQRVIRWQWLRDRFPVKMSGIFLGQIKPEDFANTVVVTKNGVLFPKNVRAFSGHSAENSQEGKNVICFTGDTKLSLVDGREVSIGDLVGSAPFYVYSYDGTKIVPGLAHSVRKTREQAPVIRVTLDNGEIITCTPDHLFMLRDGSYKEAQKLSSGESLMPLYRKYDVQELEGYELVYQPSLDKYNYTHRTFWASHNKSARLQIPGHVLNHKVLSVEVGGTADVYDLTVEEYNNFALTAGVFVHNCFVLDESSAYDETPTTNRAQKIFDMLKSSAVSRFGDRFKGFILSFPRYKDDFTMRLLDLAKGELHWYSDKGATWEIKPQHLFKDYPEKYFEFEGRKIPLEFETEFRLNPTDAKGKYLSEPPEIEQAFIEQPEKVDSAIDYGRPPIAVIEDYVEDNKIKKKFAYFNSDGVYRDYVVTVDLGLKNDSAALSVFHRDKRIDGDYIVQDLVTRWKPDPEKGITVDLINVEEFITTLSKHFHISGVWFDQWNSALLSQRLVASGLFSDIYKLTFQDYKNLKDRLYQGSIRLLPCDPQVSEIKRLILLRGGKVDHPISGGKDFCDTVCGALKILLDGGGMSTIVPSPLGGEMITGSNLHQQGGTFLP